MVLISMIGLWKWPLKQRDQIKRRNNKFTSQSGTLQAKVILPSVVHSFSLDIQINQSRNRRNYVIRFHSILFYLIDWYRAVLFFPSILLERTIRLYCCIWFAIPRRVFPSGKLYLNLPWEFLLMSILTHHMLLLPLLLIGILVTIHPSESQKCPRCCKQSFLVIIGQPVELVT